MTARLVVPLILALALTPRQVRAANARGEWVNRLKQVGLAQHSHLDVYKHFADDLIGADGQPSLSWRVKLLPFLEHDDVYRRFKPAERWDSPANKPLVSERPYLFASPIEDLGPGANVVRPLGPGTFWGTSRQRRLLDLKGEPARTILLVEVDDEHAPVWTEPRDLAFDRDNPRKGLHFRWQHSLFDRGCFVVMADAGIAMVSERIDDDSLRALMAGESSDALSLNWLEAALQLPAGWIIGPGVLIGLASVIGAMVVSWRLGRGRSVAPGELFFLVLGAEYLLLLPSFMGTYEYHFVSGWRPQLNAANLVAVPRLAGCVAAALAAPLARDRKWVGLFLVLATLLAVAQFEARRQRWFYSSDEVALVIGPAPFLVGFCGLLAMWLSWSHVSGTDKPSLRGHVLGLGWSVVPLAWFCVWWWAGYTAPVPWFEPSIID